MTQPEWIDIKCSQCGAALQAHREELEIAQRLTETLGIVGEFFCAKCIDEPELPLDRLN